MRDEIVLALQEYRRRQDTPSQRAEKVKLNLAKVHEHWDEVMACLRTVPGITDMYAGTATAIDLHWDDDKLHHLVVIELTPYGPLAAVFAHGPVPETLLGQINECVDASKLIRLPPEEIEKLQERDEYYALFSG
jgi:hypothetical protein